MNKRICFNTSINSPRVWCVICQLIRTRARTGMAWRVSNGKSARTKKIIMKNGKNPKFHSGRANIYIQIRKGATEECTSEPVNHSPGPCRPMIYKCWIWLTSLAHIAHTNDTHDQAHIQDSLSPIFSFSSTFRSRYFVFFSAGNLVFLTASAFHHLSRAMSECHSHCCSIRNWKMLFCLKTICCFIVCFHFCVSIGCELNLNRSHLVRLLCVCARAVCRWKWRRRRSSTWMITIQPLEWCMASRRVVYDSKVKLKFSAFNVCERSLAELMRAVRLCMH